MLHLMYGSVLSPRGPAHLDRSHTRILGEKALDFFGSRWCHGQKTRVLAQDQSCITECLLQALNCLVIKGIITMTRTSGVLTVTNGSVQNRDLPRWVVSF